MPLPLRPSLAGLVLSMGLCHGTAHAKTPPCFPERTVLFATDVWDEQGRRLGGIRAGQVVRVIDDDVDGNGSESLVEVQGPAVFQGRVRRIKLHVFLKRDLPLVPGKIWRVAESPMHIVRADRRGVIITWVEGHEESLHPQRADCADLVGTPPRKFPVDACDGALPFIDREPAGTQVHFVEGARPISVPRGFATPDDGNAGLLATKGGRALIEIVEWHYLREPLRIRGWTSRKKVLMGPPTSGYGIGHGCCTGYLRVNIGGHGGTLDRDIDLRVEPAAAPFARIPKGGNFRILGPAKDGMRPIVFAWPRWNAAEFRGYIEGWTEANALPPIPDSPSDYAVFGRLLAPNFEKAGSYTDYRITMSNHQANRGPAEGQVQADGRFQIRLPPNKSNDQERYFFSTEERIDAFSPDGRWAGSARATPLPGGDDEVMIAMEPATSIQGRVRNPAGAWLPGQRLFGLAGEAREPSLATVADAGGYFAFSLSPGTYRIGAAFKSGEMSNMRSAVAPIRDLIIQHREHEVVIGAVGTKDGRCISNELDVSGLSEDPERRIPVRPDCTFAVDGLPNDRTGLRFSPVGVNGGSEDVDLRDREPRRPPVCIIGKCQGDWQRCSLGVNVVGPDNVLIRNEATVEVTLLTGAIHGCKTTDGTCYVHHLPPSGNATVDVRQGDRHGRATIDLSMGVIDLLVEVK